jgi:NAD(P)-dependent dehydrogenase (short-subunit alcohol dehydrogenase family)
MHGMQPLISFAGKVAIITGGTRGIGFATAEMLGRCGARVVVSGRKEAACSAAAQRLQDQQIEAVALAAHAGKPDDSKRLVEAALKRFGRLDVVIANAGVNPVFDPLIDVSDEAWSKVMDTNVRGPVHLARAAVEHLVKNQGAMVLVSSVNARWGVVGAGCYGVSKAALEQLTRQLAVEWGPRGVRVNAVAPSTTRTDMIRALAARPGYLESVTKAAPLQRIGEPEDVAAAIVFLASSAARHITGQVLTVDGGETIARHLP